MLYEEIEKGLKKKTTGDIRKSNEKTTQGIKDTVSLLIDQAQKKIRNGEITVTDPSEIKLIVDAFIKVADMSDESNRKMGVPPLNTGVEDIIEQSVHVEKTVERDEDGEEHDIKKIKTDDIAKLSKEEVSKLMKEQKRLQNNENASGI